VPAVALVALSEAKRRQSGARSPGRTGRSRPPWTTISSVPPDRSADDQIGGVRSWSSRNARCRSRPLAPGSACGHRWRRRPLTEWGEDAGVPPAAATAQERHVVHARTA
jgi:hypothetical protein